MEKTVSAIHGSGEKDRRSFIVNALTAREKAVLCALARCGSYEQIAAELSISINTVRSHVRALYDKLDACSRAEAIVTAARLGILDLLLL